MDEMDFQLPFSDLTRAVNLDELLTREQSAFIGRQVRKGYDADESSRTDWKRRNTEANRLALQVVEKKTTPWEGASNVKFPLLTIATLQFSARAYGALIKTPEPVKCRVVGQDQDGQKAARAARIGTHMSYQCMEQDDAWEEEHDKLLMTVPIVGCSFIKSYYDEGLQRNVCQHVLAADLVLAYQSKSVEQAPRKTHVFHLTEREIRERQLSGYYTPFEFTAPPTPEKTDTDERQGLTPPYGDSIRARKLIEQHCWLDLDGDEYEEPYVVTVDHATMAVARIANRFGRVVSRQSLQAQQLSQQVQQQQDPQVAMALQQRIQGLLNSPPDILRIEPIEYFTKYPFIPSPDGGIYDLGFGALLGPINESVNTLINQLVDAGTLSNGSRGFMGRGARVKGGLLKFKPFEWKQVDVAGQTLKDAIVPLPVTPPSPVLFQLLGLLVQYAERIASVTEVMTGQDVGQNTPAYNMQAMLGQGMAVFGGIFKRIHRALRDEFRKLYALNRVYLMADEYFSVVDGPIRQVFQLDYMGDPTDVVPTADSNAILSEEKMRQASVLAQRAATVPGYNLVAVERRLLEALGVQDVQQIFPLDPKGQPLIQPPMPPDLQIKIQEEQRRAMEAQDRARQGAAKLQIDAHLAEAQLELLRAQATKTIAEAGSLENSSHIEQINAVTARIDTARQALKDLRDHEAALDANRRLAAPPGN